MSPSFAMPVIDARPISLKDAIRDLRSETHSDRHAALDMIRQLPMAVDSDLLDVIEGLISTSDPISVILASQILVEHDRPRLLAHETRLPPPPSNAFSGRGLGLVLSSGAADLTLLSEHLDGMSPYLDPAKTITSDRVSAVVAQLGWNKLDVVQRYQELSERFRIPLEWDTAEPATKPSRQATTT